MKSRIPVLFAASAAVALLLTGCGSTDSDTGGTEAASSVPGAASEPAATPTGAPIGTATIEIQGSGTATVRYSINGGAEQVEENAALPWSKEYEVYPKINTTARAEGAGTTGCTIIMDGNLVSYVSEPNPECSFAYY